MELQVSTGQTPAKALGEFSLSALVEGPLTERQMAELHQAWIEHPINPLGEIQRRGVPFSALNE